MTTTKIFDIFATEMKDPDSRKSGSLDCYDKQIDAPIIAEPPNLYKGDAMSNQKPQLFIKFIPSEEAHYLQRYHPNAFLLLSLIAERVRLYSGHPDGLEIGECHIGDYKKAGIKTYAKYRTAKDILVMRSHIKIIETCRTRKKRTIPSITGSTTRGSKVKLIRSDVWDINGIFYE